MAVKLRLMRMGKKKQPTYRVVAADSRSPRNGRFIEIIGFYEPRKSPSSVRIDNARAAHWLRHGAQPTERVEKLLKISGAFDEFRSAAEASTSPASAVEAAAASEPSASPAPDTSQQAPVADQQASPEGPEPAS